ncbi:MAG: hypothetical protein DMG65_15130 [Candidatus Angelobacter sp. Gp1-AA117]|nr:MAG: hypothetical protein DMG65_15130 [Candidatus Angelobacter sp. Gp1-AA117]
MLHIGLINSADTRLPGLSASECLALRADYPAQQPNRQKERKPQLYQENASVKNAGLRRKVRAPSFGLQAYP